jgi:AcrR family transcriptional regulator
MSPAQATTRLPAAERRQAIIEAALRVFSSGSYAGTTTAEIAREAGVSEPILYRHFESKRELWFVCLDAAWCQFRAGIEQALDEMGDARGVDAIFETAMRLRRRRVLMASLWVQGVTEATDDPETRRVVRAHMREAHDFLAGVIRRAQDAGGVPANRDAEAEAWIFVAGGLLVSFARRLGDILSQDDLDHIARERRRWLLGETSAGPG